MQSSIAGVLAPIRSGTLEVNTKYIENGFVGSLADASRVEEWREVKHTSASRDVMSVIMTPPAPSCHFGNHRFSGTSARARPPASSSASRASLPCHWLHAARLLTREG